MIASHAQRIHQHGPRALTVLAIACVFRFESAAADPLDVVNALRAGGCGRHAGIDAPVRSTAPLHLAARRLARDRRLEPALEHASYPAMSATSFHVRGSREDSAIGELLAARFCDSLIDASYSEAGFYQDGLETWIVLAKPGPGEIRLDPALTAELVLGLVNVARAAERHCGDEAFPATGAVTLSPPLNAAALGHAHELATRGEVSHEGLDGSNAGDRITRAGYTWRAAGENLAAGQRSAEAVVAAWLESPGHCSTLMGSAFTEMGVAFALAPDENPGIYWAQVFAAP